MGDWVQCLSDADLRGVVGAAGLQRGRAYVRDGRVTAVHRRGDVLLGTVVGERSYSTLVRRDDDGSWSGRCSCPVGSDCKHTAALLVAARGQTQGGAPAPAPPEPGLAGWESALAGLVPGDEDHGRGTPLGLQVELLDGQPAQGRPGQGHRGQGGRGGGRRPQAPVRRPAGPDVRVRLRPVLPGRRPGTWVRTGAAWRDLQHSWAHQWRPAERAALLALQQVHPPSRTPYGFGYQDVPVHLDDFGPLLWHLLRQVREAGVPLVPAAGLAAVSLAPPARLGVDVRRAPGGDLVLAPQVVLDGRVLVPTALVGEPAHGVLVVSDRSGERPARGRSLLLVPLDRPVPPPLARLLPGGDQVDVPAADVDRFLQQVYPDLRSVAAVASSDASVDLPEVAPPRLALDVTCGAGHRLALAWSFGYPVGADVHRVPLQGSGAGRPRRDAGAERALLDSLVLPDALEERLRGPQPERALRPEAEVEGMDAVAVVEELLPALAGRDDVLVEVHGELPDFRRTDSAPVVELSAQDRALPGSTPGTVDQDWFDLGVTISVDGEDVRFEPLFRALAADERHLLLPSGAYFRVDRPELDQLRRLIEEARGLQDRASEGLRISRFQVSLWEELAALGVVRTQSARWQAGVAALREDGDVAPPPVPSGLLAELRPYQVEGYQWLAVLVEHGLGGVLADDMGLGKTLQTLAVVCRMQETGRLPAPVLVVAPTSVVPGWAAEAQRFAPGLAVVTVTETGRRRGTPLAQHVAGADVVVTSYALLRHEDEDYQALPWSLLVLDEAQNVKNHHSRTYSCVRRLSAPSALAITGTPLENSLMDLWSLLSITAPGLFPSPERFTEVYRRPVESGEGTQALEALRRRVRPLMRRRTKEEVVTELPPKQEQVLAVEMSPAHRAVYDRQLQRERQKVLGMLDDVEKNRFAIFRSLTLLRQMSLHPALVDEAHEKVQARKVEVLVEHLRELAVEGHRALVFSQFTGFLRRIRTRLAAEGLTHCYLDGRTRDRGRRIEEFRGGDATAFLISLKAGGSGLTLTEADYVFVMDPWWNPAVEAQAVDRAHRIGQDKNVMVYRLVSAGTIEEKVMALKERKADLFARVVEDGGALSGPMTAEDLGSLFAP
ncbi:DEAD/DEAH box helicase [Pseudokineococcus sp. 1T1Z-3]|uniref:DEAD/DEAH box helicase n=1 Tax=Pseudokineococcus sp. 1T1Z-3 TaxID=3132745 RepID=UPI00309BC967